MFSKRGYDKYSNEERPDKETIGREDEVFRIQTVLSKTVLFVYYRISQPPNQSAKDTLYDRWLLDIPKLLDLAGIYGPSNSPIITQLITNIFTAIPDFDNDIQTFFNLIETHPLLQSKQYRYVEIDFTPKSLARKNYSNR